MENILLKDTIQSIHARKIIMGDETIKDVPKEITTKRGIKKDLREDVKKELIANGFIDESKEE